MYVSMRETPLFKSALSCILFSVWVMQFIDHDWPDWPGVGLVSFGKAFIISRLMFELLYTTQYSYRLFLVCFVLTNYTLKFYDLYCNIDYLILLCNFIDFTRSRYWQLTALNKLQQIVNFHQVILLILVSFLTKKRKNV